MSAIASQLEEKIDAVQQERHRVNVEMKRASVSSRNEKARRLVSRLEDCDESIANLLSQAAECLEALVSIDSRNGSSHREDQARELFEARAQDWFGSLHDVQMGLRSAVKNLRKAQVTPIAHDASSKKSASSSSTSISGSASRGHNLALSPSPSQEGPGSATMTPSSSRLLRAFVDVGSDQSAMQSSLAHLGEESKLSLSALRLQESSWKVLANSLEELAVSQRALSTHSVGHSGSRSNSPAGAVRPLSSNRNGNKTTDLTLPEMDTLHHDAQALIDAHASRDARLLSALFMDKGFAV